MVILIANFILSVHFHNLMVPVVEQVDIPTLCNQWMQNLNVLLINFATQTHLFSKTYGQLYNQNKKE